jgi:xylulokinase
MGVMLSAGGALRWFRDALAQEEIARGKAEGKDPYEYITAAAAEIPIGSEGLLFLPYLTGERTPHKDPHAKGAFIGLSLRHGKAHMARAVLEGVAYGMRDSIEIIRGMGIPVTEVRASGGGARSPLWKQILADTGRAPMVTINVDEGPSYGAAILASVAAGLYANVEEACAVIIREVSRVDYDGGNAAAYDPWYAEFQTAYTSLAPGFRRTAGLLG